MSMLESLPLNNRTHPARSSTFEEWHRGPDQDGKDLQPDELLLFQAGAVSVTWQQPARVPASQAPEPPRVS